MNGYGNSKREDELIDMVTELEDENKVLHQQVTDLRQQLTTSVPSSTVSILKSKIQEQADEIVSLNEWIGRLNGADLILKDNERLKAENSRLIKETESAVRQAHKEVDDEKQKLSMQAMELIEAEKKVKAHQTKLDDMLANESEHIKKEAQIISEKTRKYYERLYSKKSKELRAGYHARVAAHEGQLWGTTMYGIIFTLLSALKSQVFRNDFAGFYIGFADIIAFCLKCAGRAGEWMGNFSHAITQPTVAGIVYYVLYVLAVAFMLGVPLILIYFAGKKFISWYKEEIADTISLWAAFIVLAVSVVFGKELNELFSINLILFNCLIHLVYCGFRHYIRGCKKNRGYY